MHKKREPQTEELGKIVADFKRKQIKEIYRTVKMRVVYGGVSVLFLVSGFYLLYLKVAEKRYDLNFYLILTGVIFLLLLISGTIDHLRPSYIKSQKRKIHEIGRR